MLPLRPGLAIFNPEWYPLTEEFKKLMKMNDWELIPAANPVYVHKNKCYLIEHLLARAEHSLCRSARDGLHGAAGQAGI